MGNKIRYMVIGAGGTGGALGSHLAHAGYDVTFIARGRHLASMKENGLRVVKPASEFVVRPVAAYTAEEYRALVAGRGACDDAGRGACGDAGQGACDDASRGACDDAGRGACDDAGQGACDDAGRGACDDAERPTVIFVCVKGYSIDDIIPFISDVANSGTVVIPILNIFGTGGRMQKFLPDVTVTDGCIYVASEISEPGTIWMNGDILRVVFGLRKDQKEKASEELVCLLEQIRDDLNSAGINGILSDNIERDAMRKFSYVSPHGACGLYYGVSAGEMQKPGEIRDCFARLVQEVADLAEAMGIGFEHDAVSTNLAIMDQLSPSMTTSLQRDVAGGGASEIDGLIYEVPRLARQYNVSVPVYSEIASVLRARGLNAPAT